MNNFIIYGLRDPRTDEYWYVGKSINGISRAKSHINRSHNDLVNEWIDGLKSDNLIPIIDILEELDNYSLLLDKETYWINKLLKEEHPLCNIMHSDDTYILREKIKYEKNRLKDELDELKSIKYESYGPSSLSHIIYNLRKNILHLSRNDFARISGVGRTLIYDIEKGKMSMRLDKLLKILNALNIKIYFITPIDIQNE